MTLKGQYIEKIKWGTHLGRTAFIFYFSVIFLKNSLSTYMGNTLNGEKSIKIEHILVNYGTKLKVI
jgi:hypothetical protein